MTDASAAIALLRAEAERTSMRAAAARLDVSRTTVSLLLAGKYTADPGRMYTRILDVLGAVACPHLGTNIPRAQCRDWHGRTRPPAQSARGVAHWRTCQSCPNNPTVAEDTP